MHCLCKKAKDLLSEELGPPLHSRWASLLNTNHLELGHRGFIQIYKGSGDELGPYSHVVIQTGHGDWKLNTNGQSLYTQLLDSIFTNMNKKQKWPRHSLKSEHLQHAQFSPYWIISNMLLLPVLWERWNWFQQHCENILQSKWNKPSQVSLHFIYREGK